MVNRWGIVDDFILGGSKITEDGDCSHEIKRHLLLGRKVMTNLDSILKSRDITLPTKVCLVKAIFFSSSHVWMWELACKESWAPKNWYFWTVVLEKALESPLDCQEIQPVHPKGNQSWIFTGRTDAEAEARINILATWCKELIHGKRSWCWERLKAGGEGDNRGWIAGWHHSLNGQEFEQTPGDHEWQGSLVCCSSCGCKESDTTERLNEDDTSSRKVF